MLKKYKSMTAEAYEAEMRALSIKPLLSRSEACEFFHIGMNCMNKLLAEESSYRVMNGNKTLIDRAKFHEFLLKEGKI